MKPTYETTLYATHRVFTGVPHARGYVYDRTTGRVVEACDHLHKYRVGAAPAGLRAQRCAERMLKRILTQGGKTD